MGYRFFWNFSNKGVAVEVPDGIPPVRVLHGDWLRLPDPVRVWAKDQILLCRPQALHIMDGSLAEDRELKKELVRIGHLIKLTDPTYDNCYLARTDPRDVARVESKTVISTPEQVETVPIVGKGVKGALGNWIHPDDLDARIKELFPGCMQGRVKLQKWRAIGLSSQYLLY